MFWADRLRAQERAREQKEHIGNHARKSENFHKRSPKTRRLFQAAFHIYPGVRIKTFYFNV